MELKSNEYQIECTPYGEYYAFLTDYKYLVYLLQEGVQEVTVLLKSLLPYYFLDHFVMSAFL